jgi:hypothetical protein
MAALSRRLTAPEVRAFMWTLLFRSAILTDDLVGREPEQDGTDLGRTGDRQGVRRGNMPARMSSKFACLAAGGRRIRTPGPSCGLGPLGYLRTAAWAVRHSSSRSAVLAKKPYRAYGRSTRRRRENPSNPPSRNFVGLQKANNPAGFGAEAPSLSFAALRPMPRLKYGAPCGGCSPPKISQPNFPVHRP